MIFLRIFENVVGHDSMKLVVLASYFGDALSQVEGLQKERILEKNDSFWMRVMVKGACVVQYDDDEKSSLALLEQIINNNKKTALLIQHELCEKGISLIDTAAGCELEWKNQEDIRKAKEQMGKEKTEQGRYSLQDQVNMIEEWRRALAIGSEDLIREKEEESRRKKEEWVRLEKEDWLDWENEEVSRQEYHERLRLSKDHEESGVQVYQKPSRQQEYHGPIYHESREPKSWVGKPQLFSGPMQWRDPEEEHSFSVKIQWGYSEEKQSFSGKTQRRDPEEEQQLGQRTIEHSIRMLQLSPLGEDIRGSGESGTVSEEGGGPEKDFYQSSRTSHPDVPIQESQHGSNTEEILKTEKLLTDAIRTGHVSKVEDTLSEYFELIVKSTYSWIEELNELGYDHHNISELLIDEYNESPWIYQTARLPLDEHESVDLLSHKPSCIHHGPLQTKTLSQEVFPRYPEDIQVQPRELISEYCGIGGIFPAGRDIAEWVGLVQFSDEAHSTASLKYNLSESQEDNLLKHQEGLCEVLANFGRISCYLQSKKLCCNHFTILRHRMHSNGTPVIELCRISFDSGSRLLKALCSRKSRPCFIAARDIISVVDPLLTSDTLNLAFKVRALHMTSLAAQILTLGLLLFAQAHTGVIHPHFLMHPLKEIVLLGALQNSPNPIVVHLVSLSCLGNMIADEVMVFGEAATWRANSEVPLSGAKYDLLGSVSELAETWDASMLVMDNSKEYGESMSAIKIGGGEIVAVGQDNERHSESNTYLSYFTPPGQHETAKLHWSSVQSSEPSSNRTFNLWTKYLIGTVALNPSCPVNESKSWTHACNLGHMIHVGTRAPFWELNERFISLQAGQYVGVQLDQAWRKRPGITLKRKILEVPRDELCCFLEAPWGLQVSLCTGVARRVSLFVLLADIICCFAESLCPLPPEWSTLKDQKNVLEEFRGLNPREWMQQLDPTELTAVLKLVRRTLLVLQDSGIEDNGENLIVAWPSVADPYLGLKIPCKGPNFWTQILRDSEECATFAYVTPGCLETNSLKCRGVEKADWHYTSAWLDTAVCRHISNPRPGVMMTNDLTLCHGSQYYIGRPDLCLKAKVYVEGCASPCLSISESRVPESIRWRLNGRRLAAHRDRLRERFMANVQALKVGVLALKQS